MPKMVESVSLDYIKSLEDRIRVLEQKLDASEVNSHAADVVHPIVVEDVQVPKAEIGSLNSPFLDLKSVLTPDKEPAPRVSRDDLGVNMD